MSARVCHVTTVHQVPDPRIFLKQCRSLADAGFLVYALVTGDGNGFAWGRIRPISIGSRSRSRWLRLLLWRRVVAQIARINPQIVHFHDPELLPLMLLLRYWVWPRKRYVYDVHESYSQMFATYEFPWNLTKGLYRLMVRKAEDSMSLILAEDSYQEHFERTHPVVHNFPIFRPQESEPKRDKLMVYLGAVCETRGALMMVNAFAAMQVPDWRLAIIGQPSSQELGAKLRKLAAQSSLTPGQIEISDFMPYAQALGRIKSARLGLCVLSPEPNFVESLPTKVFDYLSIGIPVLLSDFPYYRRFFAGVPGIRFVDAQSLESVRDGMAEFMDDSRLEALQAEAEEGRQECLRRYSWETEAEKLVELYQAIPGAPAPFKPCAV